MTAYAKWVTEKIIILVCIITGAFISTQEVLGQTVIKACSNVDVEAVELNYKQSDIQDLKHEKEVFFDKRQSDSKGEVTIIAVGPSLGSSDIGGTSYELGCTTSGVQIIISIFGSSCFPNCDALSNLALRPEAKLTLVMHQTQSQVKAQWIMLLENGTPAPGGVHPGWIADTTVP